MSALAIFGRLRNPVATNPADFDTKARRSTDDYSVDIDRPLTFASSIKKNTANIFILVSFDVN